MGVFIAFNVSGLLNAIRATGPVLLTISVSKVVMAIPRLGKTSLSSSIQKKTHQLQGFYCVAPTLLAEPVYRKVW